MLGVGRRFPVSAAGLWKDAVKNCKCPICMLYVNIYRITLAKMLMLPTLKRTAGYK